MPELRQLRAFVAVAEELNFTRAAERLHLGQQAVSKTVAQLERELGVELLERTTREVRLTAAGAVLLREGREALAVADGAFASAVAVGRGLSGVVRVGVSPAVGPRVRDEVVGALLVDGADALQVSLHEIRPREVAPRLRDRDLDVVIARTAPGEPDVDSAALRPTPLVLVAPASHPLGAAEEPVPLTALDGSRLLTFAAVGTPFTDLLLAQCAAAGAVVEPVQGRVTGSSSWTELDRLDAVALMPEDWPGGDGLVRRPLADDVSVPLLVLWAAAAVPPAVERIRAALSS